MLLIFYSLYITAVISAMTRVDDNDDNNEY